ncbi:serine--tRNA ligase, mitochondrial-like [Anneissia japonica]|uniref:serine--tRNA ligase, mitochondrial-like n=1 Tax=Anneissia japonica TaxID=1529436 RepID=UPI0014259172|nr:serine--tRNA ligase, mitochondrial-like [Anneissia japonica]XP_033102826.1 serine--tRNA ligase, mitochondrial-like [Anneissia japonica]
MKMQSLCQRTRHMLCLYGSRCKMRKQTKDLLYIWNDSFRHNAIEYQMCTSNNEFHSRYQHWKESGADRPAFDMEHVIENVREISDNNLHRKGDADVYHVIECWKNLKEIEAALNKLEQEIDNLELKIQDKREDQGTFVSKKMELLNHQKEMKLMAEEHEENYYEAALKLPNRTHPDSPIGEESQSRIIHIEGEKAKFNFPIQGHIELGENLDILRIKNLGNVAGNRSYYLKGVGAQLEEALTRYTMERLLQRGFQLLSVPDLIKPVVFEGCGMRTKGEHTQVYWLDPQYHPQNLCLAGTGEVGLAGYFINKVLTRAELPQRVMTTSRCYRAETAHSADARGLYRVHQFTKVEMFGVTSQDSGEESAELFEEYSSIQRQLFSDLGLHFHVLDMPSEELGAPAYRKYDIEAWMPYRNSYGEISSTSNCTDFQSRRLNIMYEKSDSETEYVHTINGTACAIPRMIVAILENFQRADGSIAIPSVLQPYMCGQSVITKPSGGLLHYTRL